MFSTGLSLPTISCIRYETFRLQLPYFIRRLPVMFVRTSPCRSREAQRLTNEWASRGASSRSYSSVTDDAVGLEEAAANGLYVSGKSLDGEKDGDDDASEIIKIWSMISDKWINVMMVSGVGQVAGRSMVVVWALAAIRFATPLPAVGKGRGMMFREHAMFREHDPHHMKRSDSSQAGNFLLGFVFRTTKKRGSFHHHFAQRCCPCIKLGIRPPPHPLVGFVVQIFVPAGFAVKWLGCSETTIFVVNFLAMVVSAGGNVPSVCRKFVTAVYMNEAIPHGERRGRLCVWGGRRLLFGVCLCPLVGEGGCFPPKDVGAGRVISCEFPRYLRVQVRQSGCS